MYLYENTSFLSQILKIFAEILVISFPDEVYSKLFIISF